MSTLNIPSMSVRTALYQCLEDSVTFNNSSNICKIRLFSVPENIKFAVDNYINFKVQNNQVMLPVMITNNKVCVVHDESLIENFGVFINNISLYEKDRTEYIQVDIDDFTVGITYYTKSADVYTAVTGSYDSNETYYIARNYNDYFCFIETNLIEANTYYQITDIKIRKNILFGDDFGTLLTNTSNVTVTAGDLLVCINRNNVDAGKYCDMKENIYSKNIVGNEYKKNELNPNYNIIPANIGSIYGFNIGSQEKQIPNGYFDNLNIKVNQYVPFTGTAFESDVTYYEYTNGAYTETSDTTASPSKTYYTYVDYSRVASEFDVNRLINQFNTVITTLSTYISELNGTSN